MDLTGTNPGSFFIGPRYVETSARLPEKLEEKDFRVIKSFNPDIIFGIAALTALTSSIQVGYVANNEIFT